MKNILLIILFLLSGCSSEAQQNNKSKNERKGIVKNGMLLSFDGIDLAKYELDINYFDVNEMTLNHLLCLAAAECDEELLKILIEKRVDVNCKCEEADHVITELAFCEENGLTLTKLLLEKGADINGADEDNDSFLSYAIGADNLELVEYLIDNGADKNQRDTNKNMGCLPYHAVKSVKMIELLIAKGIQINKLCNNGRTVLHFAAKNNLVDMAQYLVKNNIVDISVKDVKGETALDYAIKLNRQEIQSIIKEKK